MHLDLNIYIEMVIFIDIRIAIHIYFFFLITVGPFESDPGWVRFSLWTSVWHMAACWQFGLFLIEFFSGHWMQMPKIVSWGLSYPRFLLGGGLLKLVNPGIVSLHWYPYYALKTHNGHLLRGQNLILPVRQERLRLNSFSNKDWDFGTEQYCIRT